MEISIGMEGDVVVVELTGDFVASAAEQFKAQMAKLMEKNFLFVVLNLDKVGFMDSSGLGAILGCLRLIEGGGGGLRLCGLQPEVRKAVELVRMDRLVDVHATRDEALKA